MKRTVIILLCLFHAGILHAQKVLVATDENSRVHFVIKNFGIKTGGDFSGLKATIKFDANNVNTWNIEAKVDAATIDTDNNSRDKHLRSPDYLDVLKFTTVNIASSKIVATAKPGIYQFNGKVTIKGIEKPLEFLFKVNKLGSGYLFTGDFNLNRRDFGVGGNSVSLADNLKVELRVFAK